MTVHDADMAIRGFNLGLRNLIGWLFMAAGTLGLLGWLATKAVKAATWANQRRNRTHTQARSSLSDRAG